MAGKRRLRWLPRLALAGAMALAGFAGFEWATWPDVAALRERDPATTAFIERYRARQRAAGRSDRVAWRPVPARRISPELKIADERELELEDGQKGRGYDPYNRGR